MLDGLLDGGAGRGSERSGSVQHWGSSGGVQNSSTCIQLGEGGLLHITYKKKKKKVLMCENNHNK